MMGAEILVMQSDTTRSFFTFPVGMPITPTRPSTPVLGAIGKDAPDRIRTGDLRLERLKVARMRSGIAMAI
jgi:hypothetical protein